MHEQTYDPVLNVAELPKWRLTSPLRPPGPGRALVLVRDTGPSLTVHSGEEIPSSRYGVYRSVFTVDLQEHRLVLDIPLLSRDPTFSFRSRVALICKVTDPAKVVTRGIRDMSGALYAHLRQTLREVARDYDIAEFHDAERALNTTVSSFAGDDAVRLRSVHVELLVDEDEIATSGREFRNVARETRLSRMRRTRHVEMIREEGVEGLIAEIMEREGPRAALAWIEKSEAEKREVKREVLRMVLERGDSDREPFEQAELERAVLEEVLRDGDGLVRTSAPRGRLRGSLSRALDPAPAEPGEEAPEDPPLRGEVLRKGLGANGVGRVSGVVATGGRRDAGAEDVPGGGRDIDHDAHRRRPSAPDVPPADEPLPPTGSAPPPRTAPDKAPKPKVSRVRGTAKRRPGDPGGEPR